MVELQCDDVRLAAIDARVRPQVIPQKAPILVSTSPNAVDLTGDVGGAIANVVRTPIGGVARSTMGLPRAECLVPEGKLPDRLFDATPMQRRGASFESSREASATKDL